MARPAEYWSARTAAGDQRLYPLRRSGVILELCGYVRAAANLPLTEPAGGPSMPDIKARDIGETPSVEVRAYRHGKLVGTKLCETIDEAAALVTSWEETPGVECEVDEISGPAKDVSAFEVDTGDVESTYPHAEGTDDR